MLKFSPKASKDLSFDIKSMSNLIVFFFGAIGIVVDFRKRYIGLSFSSILLDNILKYK